MDGRASVTKDEERVLYQLSRNYFKSSVFRMCTGIRPEDKNHCVSSIIQLFACSMLYSVPKSGINAIEIIF